MGNELNVRPERAGDEPGIRAVHLAAFPEDIEARIVDRLRERGALTISLVAEQDGGIVGHIAFSPVICESGDSGGLGLAPVAVLPDHQNTGIGSALIRAGLDTCRASDVPFVVLLGDPAYYARFGFHPASQFGLRCVYHEGEAFQVIGLREGALNDITGFVHYYSAFDEITST